MVYGATVALNRSYRLPNKINLAGEAHFPNTPLFIYGISYLEQPS